MDKIFFIGRFPPPYGGATIKSEILYSSLSEKVSINKFDTEMQKENKVKFLLSLIKFIFDNRKRRGIICVATVSLFKFTKIINMFIPQMLGNICVFAIGGVLDKLIVENDIDIKILKKYRVIFVECKELKSSLEKYGLNNIEVIPNCRLKPIDRGYSRNDREINHIRCLFMSRIDKEKGVFKILDAFNKLGDNLCSIDFYGPIEESIKGEFNKRVKRTNMRYMGIVDSSKENIYQIINKYDLLLFPTDHIGEGYPGILAEAKIAGIPILTSDFRYSKEIVNHLEDGFIIQNNTSEEIAKAIKSLYKDTELLEKLRYNSFISGENCIIDTYLDKIMNYIMGGKNESNR